ncbi:peroxidase family protein [Zafaria sp. J156]|uniref:peroxidase family protein n=2 Tax=Zafaria sp. J156 TaxID=3116490 RepID=UPI002E75E0B4|nr:peroxidase family protein [Zafaria sp. J156]MEE1619985.1 peroxidase family protein [Zafaria sp. J156]
MFAAATALIATGALAPLAAATAAPPPGQDFNVTQGDLEFIIKQIDIAEDHAKQWTRNQDASPLCDTASRQFHINSQTYTDQRGLNDSDRGYCVGTATMPYGLRTVDGRWNNLLPGQDGYGTANRVFPRLLTPDYITAGPVPFGIPGNPFGTPGTITSYEQTDGFVFDTRPRTISNLIVDQTTANPAAVEVMDRVDGAGVENGAVIRRLAGENRYGTAAVISQSNFDAGVPTVNIANGENFPDSLAAGPAARSDFAPLLLVRPGVIPPETAAELLRLEPQSITIVGGTGAVSVTVESLLGNYTEGAVNRVAGADRYETAAAISAHAFNPGVGRVYIAFGGNFPDSLAAAAPAARDGHPILLTRPGVLPPATIAELQRLQPQEIVIVGGPGVVTPAVQTALGAFTTGTVTRLAGIDRYETMLAISQANYPDTTTTVYIAIGTNFPDALAAAPVAGLREGPVLLSRPGATLDPSLVAELQRLNPDRVIHLGGTGVLTTATETQIRNLLEGTHIQIPDIATDEGLSASATSLFVIFGQFFDHGLDLINKGGNGTVVVPLNPDDPLYRPGASTNFLTLSRGTIDDTDGGREHINRTTPFVDQNQTYTSHASHQAFLREYTLDGNGSPVPTGRILNGTNSEGAPVEGLPTWADVKKQARDILGIDLEDFDVLDVPLIATDPYGHLLLGPEGRAQLAFEDGNGGTELREAGVPLALNGPEDGLLETTGLTANASFLDDIAHGATPGPDVPDPADPDGPTIPGYDNVALDAHFITGDGRGNENIGLTAVHHVFHAEHNRVMDQIQDVLETELAVDGNESGQELLERFEADGFWNYGERLFQAARFFTEMQYQHLVFEEFARRIQPNIDTTVLNENSYQPDVDSAIVAEFAHAVYRFGHSMLRESVPREYDGEIHEMALFDAFLNPAAFNTAPDGSGTILTANESAGGIIKGLANQTANGVDEFVTHVLRNQLLGLPLDLATINMVRARETGTPGLQAARATIFAETRDPQLEPYESWEDFRLSMKNPESIANFIAAYGVHPTLPETATLAERRAAGTALSLDEAFMNAPAAETGLSGVDLWMGGLAEKPFVFGGMLGSTFNYVFEKQLEDLQNGDRFYYLTRNLGNSLFHTLEANSLSQIVLRNTDADRVPHDVFAAPQITFDLRDSQAELNAAGLTGNAVDGWRFTEGDHVTIQGTDGSDGTVGHDIIRGGLGDDSIWGLAGNDRIEGDDGNDAIMGGDGDDILTDLHGDDRIQGEAGNDAINGGPGIDDLLFGGSGTDYILGGHDASTVFGGLDDDFILGSSGRDNLRGDEGDDWIDGGNNADLLVGDLSNTMQNDPGLYHGGHDVLVGRTGNNDHDAEGGDDIMVGGPGTDRFGGMLGFDWVTFDGSTRPVVADMDTIMIVPGPESAIMSRYLQVEGWSGGFGNDVVRGNNNVDAFVDPEINQLGYGHRLTEEHLNRIGGLRDLLTGGAQDYSERFMVGAPFTDEDMNNNILLGGPGNDLIEPRSGTNFIDGDAWLDVAVSGPDGNNGTLVTNNVGDFQNLIFSGQISPADLEIVRQLQNVDAALNGTDTVLIDAPRADFTITRNVDGVVVVASIDNPEENTHYLRNVEFIQFADEPPIDTATLEVTDLTPLTVTTNDIGTPAEGDTLTATVDVDGPAVFELQVIALDGAGNEVAITTQSNDSGEFEIGATEDGQQVQVVAVVATDDGPQQGVSDASSGETSELDSTPPTLGAGADF